MNEPKAVPVKFTIDEATAQGHYVNFANILHNPTEFVFDFGRVVPGRPDVKVHESRAHDSLPRQAAAPRAPGERSIYERSYGEIRSDFGVAVPVPSDTKTN